VPLIQLLWQLESMDLQLYHLWPPHVKFPEWRSRSQTERCGRQRYVSARISSTVFTLIKAIYESLEILTLRSNILRVYLLMYGAAGLCVLCPKLEINLVASLSSVDFSSNAVPHSRRKNASNRCKFLC
jgi:hypothetical protein